MWALVQDGKVVEIYNYPKSVTIDEVRYPSNMFRLYTKEEKENIGIYDVIEKAKPSVQFGYTSQITFEYDTVNKVVNEIFDIFDNALEDVPSKDEKGNIILDDHNVPMVTAGLKTQEINKTKHKAYGDIKRFNWIIERSIYDNTQTIPSDLNTYVSNVRIACATICTAIESTTTMDEFKTLFEHTYGEDREVTKKAVIHNWPDDYNVRKYTR